MRENKSKLVYSTDQGKISEEKLKTSGKENKKIADQKGTSSGQNQKLHLRLERKGRGGKTVTLVCGLGLPMNEMETLLKEIKARLGTGGALKETTLELQGDHREAITAFLRENGFRI
ncbi:MAG: translation initiation factor [Nitrospiraceae bacterium]|nr:translation initiation factor [Nitrospiraceae bacterium]